MEIQLKWAYTVCSYEVISHLFWRKTKQWIDINSGKCAHYSWILEKIVFFKEPGEKWTATAFMIKSSSALNDSPNVWYKNKVQELKQQVTFPSLKTQMLIWCNNFISILEIKKINLEFGQVLQLQANQREFCLLCTVKCTIYMLKIKKRNKKNSTWLQKMADSFCSSWKSIQFTNDNINKKEKNIQTTVWFFGKQENKINQETLILTTKSKPLTSRLQKRETKKSS